MLNVTVHLTNYAGIDSTETFETESMTGVARILITYKPSKREKCVVTKWTIEEKEEDLFSLRIES